MKWKPSPPELIEIFESAIEAVPEAERRKMFGYPCVFTNGYMFAGLHQDSLVLKLPPDEYAAFLKLEGATPFEPMPGRKMAGFVAVPRAMFQSEDLKTWLKKAFASTRSLPPKKPKTGARPRAKKA